MINLLFFLSYLSLYSFRIFLDFHFVLPLSSGTIVIANIPSLHIYRQHSISNSSFANCCYILIRNADRLFTQIRTYQNYLVYRYILFIETGHKQSFILTFLHIHAHKRNACLPSLIPHSKHALRAAHISTF